MRACIQAIKENDLTQLQKSFQTSYLTTQDENGNTLLLIACQQGTAEMVAWLHQQGAALDQTRKNFPSIGVCYQMLFNKNNSERRNIMKYLLSKKIEIPEVVVELLRGQTHKVFKCINDDPSVLHESWSQIGNMQLAHVAAVKGCKSVIERLVNFPAYNCSRQDAIGCTPWLIAANQGRLGILQCLYDHDKTVTADKDNNDSTALHHAIFSADVHTVVWLLGLRENDQSVFDVHARNKDGFTPWLIAANQGRQAILHRLYHHDKKVTADKDNDDATALHHAVASADVHLLDLFLTFREKGQLVFDVHARTKIGLTPWLIAAMYGQLAILQCLYQHDKTVATDKNNFDDSALHIAVSLADEKTVVWLLGLRENRQAALDVHAKTKRGLTPWLIAAAEGQLSILERLYKYDKTVATDTGNSDESALHIAAYLADEPTLVWLLGLRENGQAALDVHAKAKGGLTPWLIAAGKGQLSILQCLYDHDKTVTADKDNNDSTSLHHAVFSADVHTVVWLLGLRENNQAVLDVHAKTKGGLTPWLIAVMKGRLEILQCLYQHDNTVVADKSNEDETALHFSVALADLQTLKWLLSLRENGQAVLDVHKENKKGLTPWLIAANLGHLAILRWLYTQEPTVVLTIHSKPLFLPELRPIVHIWIEICLMLHQNTRAVKAIIKSRVWKSILHYKNSGIPELYREVIQLLVLSHEYAIDLLVDLFNAIAQDDFIQSASELLADMPSLLERTICLVAASKVYSLNTVTGNNSIVEALLKDTHRSTDANNNVLMYTLQYKLSSNHLSQWLHFILALHQKVNTHGDDVIPFGVRIVDSGLTDQTLEQAILPNLREPITGLVALDFSGNAFTEQGLLTLLSMLNQPTLEHLNVSNNNIVCDSDGAWGGLAEKELAARGARGERLQKIKRIDLSGNYIYYHNGNLILDNGGHCTQDHYVRLMKSLLTATQLTLREWRTARSLHEITYQCSEDGVKYYRWQLTPKGQTIKTFKLDISTYDLFIKVKDLMRHDSFSGPYGVLQQGIAEACQSGLCNFDESLRLSTLAEPDQIHVLNFLFAFHPEAPLNNKITSHRIYYSAPLPSKSLLFDQPLDHTHSYVYLLANKKTEHAALAVETITASGQRVFELAHLTVGQSGSCSGGSTYRIEKLFCRRRGQTNAECRRYILENYNVAQFPTDRSTCLNLWDALENEISEGLSKNKIYSKIGAFFYDSKYEVSEKNVVQNCLTWATEKLKAFLKIDIKNYANFLNQPSVTVKNYQKDYKPGFPYSNVSLLTFSLCRDSLSPAGLLLELPSRAQAMSATVQANPEAVVSGSGAAAAATPNLSSRAVPTPALFQAASTDPSFDCIRLYLENRDFNLYRSISEEQVVVFVPPEKYRHGKDLLERLAEQFPQSSIESCLTWHENFEKFFFCFSSLIYHQIYDNDEDYLKSLTVMRSECSIFNRAH